MHMGSSEAQMSDVYGYNQFFCEIYLPFRKDFVAKLNKWLENSKIGPGKQSDLQLVARCSNALCSLAKRP